MNQPRRHLDFRYLDTVDVDDALLRSLWELRVEMLTLTRSPEEDWRFFRDFVRREHSAVLAFFDEHGTVQGFFTIAFLPVDHEEKRGLLLYSKYFYFRKIYRGHYKTSLAPWILLPIAVRSYGLRSMHFVTTAFPQSFVSLSRSAGNVRTLADPSITSWQRHALGRFLGTYFANDWDPEIGVVRNQNVADTSGLPLSEDAKRLHARYEALNPNWRKGCSLPIIFSVDQVLIRTTSRRALRRIVRQAA